MTHVMHPARRLAARALRRSVDRPRSLFLPASVALLAAAALIVPLPVFLERPGTPLGLAGAVTVDAPGAGPVDGDFLMTAVHLGRGTVAEVALGRFDPTVEFVPVQHVLPPGEGDAAFFAGQRDVFASSADVAAAVGLTAAGYEVAATGEGAGVVEVVPGAAADGLLRPGDVVVAVDGEPVATSEDLAEAITGTAAGPAAGRARPRTLTVLRDDGGEGGRVVELEVTLTPRPLAQPLPGADPEDRAPRVGVRTQTVEPGVALPFPVTVDAGRTGGPSAGLMIALTVYDQAEPVDLAAGRLIAGTGALDAGGAVLPIGGIRHKVVSAVRAGAEVFLAPAAQVEDARAAVPAGSAIRVVGVATVDDAIAALRDATAGGT